ncbi:hypothetical protein BGX23_010277 [Mortierella sp. AD031]|nr:hypothetical protein BGX23_010277 [Mortierella sp. AD031]
MMSWNPYKLPPTTNIFEINHPSQLTQLACSIFQSTVVGMSLLRPLERPWAHCVEAESELKRQGDLVQDAAGVWGFNGQSTATRQKEGDTHGGATVVWGFKNSSPATRQQGGGDGYEGAECAGGEGGEINARFKVAFLQLACNHDDRVYVIELEPFLNDPDHTLPKLLSEVFSNRRICKLVYNWSNENAFLISLFSLLEHQRCPRKNIIDLHYIWFVQESQNQIAKGPATNTFDSSSSSSSSSASNSSSDQGARHFNPKAPRVYTPALKVVAWTTDKPLHPTAMLRPGHPTVSGLLHRLTGKVLKRVSSLTWDQWKVRPLQPSLRVDAALSTQCLFDIFEALNNGQRIDQHATAAFKTTFR